MTIKTMLFWTSLFFICSILLTYNIAWHNGKKHVVNTAIAYGIETAHKITASEVLAGVTRYDRMLYALSNTDDSAKTELIKGNIEEWRDSLRCAAGIIQISICGEFSDWRKNKEQALIKLQGENRQGECR